MVESLRLSVPINSSAAFIMGLATSFFQSAAAVLLAAIILLNLKHRAHLPNHLLHHKVIYVPELLSSDAASELTTLLKSMAEFPTNVNDLKFYQTLHEHIGEAQPIGEKGVCEHPYLVPSSNKTHCILPGRVDVGRHYILTGGVQGLKNSYELLVSRVQSFGRYIFEPEEHPAVAKLFASEEFQAVARSVCPPDKQVLDPFQFNFITQVPGQTVAMHVDAPYFWGATRFQFPQWLLACMVFSNLFQDKFIDQVQVVAYLHRWTDVSRRAGEFVYWDTEADEPKRIPPTPRAGSAVDGSKTVHAAAVYQPNADLPYLDKSKDNRLTYKGSDLWELTSNNLSLRNYSTEDLRLTIVYRARCFRSQDEVQTFRQLSNKEAMSLESILQTFKEDLVRRRRASASQLDSMSRLDFAFLLLDEYIQYPWPPSSLVPYNYCAVMKLLPQLKPILQIFCN